MADDMIRLRYADDGTPIIVDEHLSTRTPEEIATMIRLEARSHANTLEDLAKAERQEWRRGSVVADALEKAARFLRHFADESGR